MRDTMDTSRLLAEHLAKLPGRKSLQFILDSFSGVRGRNGEAYASAARLAVRTYDPLSLLNTGEKQGSSLTRRCLRSSKRQ